MKTGYHIARLLFPLVLFTITRSHPDAFAQEPSRRPGRRRRR